MGPIGAPVVELICCAVKVTALLMMKLPLDSLSWNLTGKLLPALQPLHFPVLTTG